MYKKVILLFLIKISFCHNFNFQENTPNVFINDQLLDNGFLGGINYAVVRWADWDYDGDIDLFILDEDGKIKFYQNIGNSLEHKFVIHNTNLLNLDNISWFYIQDFDNDGDLDVVTEFSDNPSYVSYYLNDNQDFINLNLIQTVSNSYVISQQGSIPTFCDIDNDGDYDFFTVSLEGTVTFYENIELINQKPFFNLVSGNWQDIIVTGEGRHGANAINFIDLDNDNDFDLVWGDYYQSSIYVIWNEGNREFPNMDNINFLRYFPVDDPIYTVGRNMPTFNDIDGDGDYDLFVSVLGGTGGIQLINNFYFYENIDGVYQFVTDNFLNSIDLVSDSCPALADIDSDGDLDLFIGQKFSTETTPYNGRIHFYRNIGNRTNPIFELIDNEFLGTELGTDLCPSFGDIDSDGDLDLIIGTYVGNIDLYKNIGNTLNHNFIYHSTIDGGENFWFSTPYLHDFNFDNKLDIVSGNIYGDLKLYYQNEPFNFNLEPNFFSDISVGYYSAPFMFDIDLDEDMDMIVSGQTRHRIYENVNGDFVENESDIIPYLGKNAKITGSSLFFSNQYNLISGVSTGGLYILSNNLCFRGDLNADETINILDITLFVDIVLDNQSSTSYSMCTGDINNDYGLNILDIINLIDLIIF